MYYMNMMRVVHLLMNYSINSGRVRGGAQGACPTHPTPPLVEYFIFAKNL